MLVDMKSIDLNNLTVLKLDYNCYHFNDVNDKLIPADIITSKKVFVLFDNELHLVKPFNEPFKVDLGIISPYYVDQIYIIDDILTNGKKIHLKFFLDKCDWSSVRPRREYYSILEYVKNESEDVYDKLYKQSLDTTYFPKVYIMN